MSTERRLEPRDVRGCTQRGVDLYRADEGGPARVAIVGADELSRSRLQRLCRQQRTAGVAVVLRSDKQQAGIVIEQATAIQRVRPPVRDLRPVGEGRGMPREG